MNALVEVSRRFALEVGAGIKDFTDALKDGSARDPDSRWNRLYVRLLDRQIEERYWLDLTDSEDEVFV